MRLLLCSITVAVLSFAAGVHAQSVAGKHPRVAELESILNKDAATFLKGRFPDLPFLVTINIDPLRRITEKGGRGRVEDDERLPFSDIADDEIQDEWDDPRLTVTALMNRVQKAVVTVAIPSSISEEDGIEIQQTLMSLLHLTPARDSVSIQRRNWKQPMEPQTGLAILGVIFLFSVLGLYLISRNSVTRLSQAMQTAGGTAKSSEPTVSSPPVMMPLSDNGLSNVPIRGGGGGGDVKLNDPVKTREMVSAAVRTLSAQNSFPTFSDMLLFEKLAQTNPSLLGGLLGEFAVDVQKKIFGYSFSQYWLEAFNEPGELTNETAELLQKLVRTVRDDKNAKWEKLLICIWRLDNARIEFVRSLGQKDALALLHALPKSIAVQVARSAFPGNWAAILDTNFTAEKFSDEKIESITTGALKHVAIRDFAILQRYKHERDLLGYLKTTDPTEERDIYLAADKKSIIHALRPPFFKLLEYKGDHVSKMVKLFTLDDWSLVMLNVPKADRKEIEAQFSDKQRFLYVEKLRYWDSHSPDKSRVGLIREKMARTFQLELEKWEQEATVTPIDAGKASEDKSGKKKEAA